MNHLIKGIVCFGLALASWGTLPAACQAQQLFEFVQDGTGDVLATLEVLHLPATTVADFGEFEITGSGDLFFGTSLSGLQSRPAMFTAVGGGVELGLDGGLLSLDNNGPGSSNFVLFLPQSQFNYQFPELLGNSMLLAHTPSFGMFVDASGRFLLAVPEPSGLLLFGVAALGGVGVRSRKRLA